MVWDKAYKHLSDAHCHLLDYENEVLLDRVGRDQLDVFLVTTRPEQFDAALEVHNKYPSIRPGLGLFPLYLDRLEEQIELFEEKLNQTRFIGEVGLDFSADKDAQKKQVLALEKILELAEQKENCVISLHSRRSAETVLSMINGVKADFIMHWFSGSIELISDLTENIYFSVNPVMIKSRSGKQLIREINPHQVLLESDGPYVQLSGESCTPYELNRVVNSLAHLWKSDPESVVKEINVRFNRLFS